MSAPKLVLHPDSQAAPAAAAIRAALHEIDFIGADFDLDGQPHCYTGDGFLDGISFLGCAPSIQLDPPANAAELASAARAGQFCHVQLLVATEAPRLRYNPRQAPRCRHCRTAIPAAALNTAKLSCPGCARHLALDSLNWRQAGGHARLFLDIWGIHTAEAVPSDRLLEQLARASGGPWQFFYIED